MMIVTEDPAATEKDKVSIVEQVVVDEEPAKAAALSSTTLLPIDSTTTKETTPLEVQVSITVQSVENISTTRETADLGILLDIYWNEEDKGNKNITTPCWNYAKSFQTVNAVVDYERQERTAPHHVKDNLWHAQLWISTTFKQNFADSSIRAFPFDCQTIIARFEMGKIEEMIYRPVKGRDVVLSVEQELCPLSDWTWVGADVVTTATKRSLSKQKNSYAQMIICLHLARDWRHYIWRVFMFIFFFSISSLIPFALDPVEEFSERVSVSLTVILTQVAFMFSVQGSLPATKEISILERYIFLSVVANFFVTFETATCKYLDRRDIDNQCETVDPIIGTVMLGLLVVEHIAFVVGCFWVRSKGLRDLTKAYKGTPPKENILVASDRPCDTIQSEDENGSFRTEVYKSKKW